MSIPTPSEFEHGYMEYQRREKRATMYQTETFLVFHFWGQPAKMADGLEVLLRTWNQAIYRYGSFDFDKLESCIGTNIGLLTRFRAKNILDATAEDEQQIKELFEQFLTALARADGNKSPVAAAKALHLLAPDFFPLWDKQIALAYGLDYSRQPIEKFVAFCKASQSIARQLRPLIQLPSRKTLLKLIDEYNYAKYTKQWI